QLSPSAHARCALLLLRTLPPARHAALHHLRTLFDHQVCAHLLEREENLNPLGPNPSNLPPPPAGGGLEEVVEEVQKVLGGFIKANPKAWAPLVASWSMDLMGQLSSKYAGRPGVPHPAGGLNELLQLWMSCGATRALMDIYTQCLSAMAGGGGGGGGGGGSQGPDACVDALLDTSIQHSPHFDWVVAHIGSSFPNTIISRVLSCGLQDFCSHGEMGGTLPVGGGALGGDKRVPKLASVVGILGHLAARHGGSIRQELLRMFHQSLNNPPSRDPHQKATVPFLLQLALMSPTLLGTISNDLVPSLTPNVLNQLHHHLGAFSREELDNMVTMVVHLICQSSRGAYQILQFLLTSHLLTRLSSLSLSATKSILQHLVEGALRKGNSHLFGAEPQDFPTPKEPFPTSLLDGNQKFTPTLNCPGGVWSVFHSGVIGKGFKPLWKPEEKLWDPEKVEKEQQHSQNIHIFLNLLLRCCQRGKKPQFQEGKRNQFQDGINPEAAKAVAAALVENICPEASGGAGGELIWPPPEDQSRGNVERDLRICRKFRDHPLLFPLLHLVATGPPALCYCSVLLRGLLGGLMGYWESCREFQPSGSPWHLQASCSLVSILAEGSLIPPVLGKVQELFQHLAPFEVHLLLLSLWEYLRENQPLPQKFTFQPQQGLFLRDFGREGEVGKHLGVLHSVLHKNIQ
ncbi:PREDICTED: integrator complex subunit 5, partial [Chaetura pelagica]|uniref:integrator complex subunit 5 n=1 Tax=Chaetura pelagica TaxID=8897 RepID=UPI000523C126